jgi:pyruvate formate lyase activating enzyme
MTTGTILKIERFAIHDGPGIRTVVFLKGCPLRCKWCSTPESQDASVEIGYFLDECTRCARCAEVCPPKAISVSDDGNILTEKQVCNSCGQCVETCFAGARTRIGKRISVREVMCELEKDLVFYHNSDGGITLSGGEPTMQPEFCLGILKACREIGIHTAIETSGYADWDTLDPILRYSDLVYVDIKHMSSAEHEKLTEKRNELILENIQKIAAAHVNIPLIIRIPVVPGHNDSRENVVNTAEFSCRLNRVERVELLPYHRFGISMYSVVMREYSLMNVEAPHEAHLRELQDLIRSYGIDVQIGG